MGKRFLIIGFVICSLSVNLIKAEAAQVIPSYVDNGNGLVYENAQTNQRSNVYPIKNYIYSDKYQSLLLSADNDNDVKLVILQPIFNNQPKTWVLFRRDFSLPFPGLSGAETKFLFNSNLLLVTSADGAPQTGFNPYQPETIPIDYSIFTTPVKQPTCYAMPEDHKLRPCTDEESKLRTPALKVFLGEKN